MYPYVPKSFLKLGGACGSCATLDSVSRRGRDRMGLKLLHQMICRPLVRVLCEARCEPARLRHAGLWEARARGRGESWMASAGVRVLRFCLELRRGFALLPAIGRHACPEQQQDETTQCTPQFHDRFPSKFPSPSVSTTGAQFGNYYFETKSRPNVESSGGERTARAGTVRASQVSRCFDAASKVRESW